MCVSVYEPSIVICTICTFTALCLTIDREGVETELPSNVHPLFPAVQ